MWLLVFGWFLLGFCADSFAVICCWVGYFVNGADCVWLWYCVMVVFCSCVCCLGFDLGFLGGFVWGAFRLLIVVWCYWWFSYIWVLSCCCLIWVWYVFAIGYGL